MVFDLPSLESGAPWYWSISKSRTALFRLFGRMLHLAPQMLHPVDIDSSDSHNCCSFRVTRAITSENNALSEFYGFDDFKPLMDSFIPKKGYLNINRVLSLIHI